MSSGSCWLTRSRETFPGEGSGGAKGEMNNSTMTMGLFVLLMMCWLLTQYTCSSNYLETCAALSGLCKLVTLEMVPAVIDQVANLLSHNQVAVRKKAIMVFHRLQKIDPELIKHYYDVCRKSLYDKDPSVMVSGGGMNNILILFLCSSTPLIACLPNTQSSGSFPLPSV